MNTASLAGIIVLLMIEGMTAQMFCPGEALAAAREGAHVRLDERRLRAGIRGRLRGRTPGRGRHGFQFFSISVVLLTTVSVQGISKDRAMS